MGREDILVVPGRLGFESGGGNGVLEAFADCREGANEALWVEKGCVAGKKP
jgi:hypothetical protein